ncbi:winged helix-turn-helix domain-containing protein [Nonomuraea sp. B19D2]|uniref:ArsR/SmtB family transcription factor n=1 Tax=Nonomuraea sp. B19D2 TaxID=3159561 RepID=UPI0032DB55B5
MGDAFVLSTPAHFKALGHPVRHRMVNVLRQRPATLAELAEVMGAVKGTIAYHVKVLQDAGLVRVVDTRHVRGGTQQYFGLVSGAFKPESDSTEWPEFLMNAALAEMTPPRDGEVESTSLHHLWLTPDQAGALVERLKEILAERPQRQPAAMPYGLLLSLYRADIPTLPDQPTGRA